MLKNFFTAFLGSMAALWLTVILSGVLSIVMMVVMMAGGKQDVSICYCAEEIYPLYRLDG